MTTAPRLKLRLRSDGLFIVEPDGLIGPFGDPPEAAAYVEARDRRRLGRRKRLRTPLPARLAALGVAVAAVLAGCQAEPSPQVQRITAERVAQELVRSHLRDPGSAQFSNLRHGDLDGIASVCGLVNARNGFGGYEGGRRFIVAGDAVLIAGEIDGEAFNGLWLSACVPSVSQ